MEGLVDEIVLEIRELFQELLIEETLDVDELIFHTEEVY